MKRLLVMILSFMTIICFGYSLGALGVTAIRSPHWKLVFLWLFCGLLSAFCAITLWKSYLKELEAEKQIAK
ncbi:MAG: hypothetical protein Q4C78_02560 [Synergistaceae bacterium]|nr:hypothetical protein [Synergistaceae bacterium]